MSDEEAIEQLPADMRRRDSGLKAPTGGMEHPNDLEDLMESDEEASAQDKDMMSMFASVWVKVEVDEDSSPNMPFNMSSCKTEQSERSLRTRPNAASAIYHFDEDNVKNVKTSKRVYKKPTKELKCEQCNYTTMYKSCLKMHVVANHTTGQPYACHYCGYTTKYPTSLNRHILIQHELKDMPLDNEKAVFKCTECKYTSHFKWNLNAHKRKHKLVKQFKCPDCDYSTAYRHNFQKHSKVHAEGVFFKCDKCPFVTRFEGHITRHLAKIHNVVTDKAFLCDLCDFSTKVRWRLNTHKQRSKQEKPLHCPFCNFETLYMCESKKHKVVHYNEMYGNRGKKNIHTLIPSPVNNLVPQTEPPMLNPNPVEISVSVSVTPDKKRVSNQRYELDPDCVEWNSIQVIESNDKEKPFLCHMCSYSSKFKASVQRHFQRHHTGSTNRPYKCCNCDFSTKTKDQIALHNKRSLTEKLMQCKICSFTTNYKCQYVAHQKTHYDYKCTACSYTCRQKYELQKHYTMFHLGNGLKCSFCEYRATRKESLLCHETIHTGEKPFKCALCSYKSVRKSLLENHMKRYHSDQQKDVTIVSDDKIESLKVCLAPGSVGPVSVD